MECKMSQKGSAIRLRAPQGTPSGPGDDFLVGEAQLQDVVEEFPNHVVELHQEHERVGGQSPFVLISYP